MSIFISNHYTEFEEMLKDPESKKTWSSLQNLDNSDANNATYLEICQLFDEEVENLIVNECLE
jgi:hypothetical protein